MHTTARFRPRFPEIGRPDFKKQPETPRCLFDFSEEKKGRSALCGLPKPLRCDCYTAAWRDFILAWTYRTQKWIGL
jgi:hypothetical protein